VREALAHNHDAFNIQRLFTVYNVLFMLIIILALPYVLLNTKNILKIFALTVTFGMFYLVTSSNHSPLDIWWMRRYLVILLPLTVIILGLIYSIVSEKRCYNQRQIAMAAMMISVISLVAIMPHMKKNYKIQY